MHTVYMYITHTHTHTQTHTHLSLQNGDILLCCLEVLPERGDLPFQVVPPTDHPLQFSILLPRLLRQALHMRLNTGRECNPPTTLAHVSFHYLQLFTPNILEKTISWEDWEQGNYKTYSTMSCSILIKLLFLFCNGGN